MSPMGMEVENWAERGQPLTAWCCLSIHPENIRKPKGFLIFSGSRDKQHRAVRG